MKESILQQKAFEFATNIVLFYENYSENHKDNTMSKQLLRSGTSVGANINEAQYGNYQVALKSCGGTKGKTVIETNVDELFILTEDIQIYIVHESYLHSKGWFKAVQLFFIHAIEILKKYIKMPGIDKEKSVIYIYYDAADFPMLTIK